LQTGVFLYPVKKYKEGFMQHTIAEFKEIADHTQRCPHDFACLWRDESGIVQCSVDYAIGDNILFINDNEKPPAACPYKIRYGYGYLCCCPMHYAICRFRDTAEVKRAVPGVWIAGEDDVIIETNKKMEAIAGMSRERILGTRLRTGLPQETIRNFMPHYEKAKETRTILQFDKVNIHTPSGQQNCQSGYLIPRLKDGRVVRMICMVEEVAGLT